MREPSQTGLNLAVAGVCAAIGAIGLPLVLGGSSPGPAILGAAGAGPSVLGGGGPGAVVSVVWLVLACVVSLVMVLAMVPLSLWFARAIAGLTLTRSQSLLLARLVAIGLALVVLQATLRPPLVVLLGSPLDAALAAAALTLVLALLVWIYEAGRPALQQLTRLAIDAAIPTLNPPAPPEPTLRATRTDDATLRATPSADEPTQRTPRADDDATLRAAPPDDDVTLRSPRADDDATLRAAPPDDDDATLRAEDHP